MDLSWLNGFNNENNNDNNRYNRNVNIKKMNSDNMNNPPHTPGLGKYAYLNKYHKFLKWMAMLKI